MTSANPRARGAKSATAKANAKIDFQDFGYLRAAAVAPVLSLANPEANAKNNCLDVINLIDLSNTLDLSI